MLGERTNDFRSLDNKYYYIMARKFDTILESAMRRFNGNTLVVGDRVKFVNNWTGTEWARGQAAVKMERLKEMIDSGDNIRISAVKSLRPAVADSGHFEVVDDVYYDIVREAAPGFYSQTFTVPSQLVEWLDDYPNLAGETPDGQKRVDTSHVDAREVNPIDDNANMGVKAQTGVGQGDRSLGGQNVPLDHSPTATDGLSYTQRYLES